VRSLIHVWPFSAPLQPLLRMPFPATPLIIFLCTSHMSSLAFLPHLPLPTPRFPYAFLTMLYQYWHICCLDTGFECLPLLRLLFWRYRWNRLILYSPKSPKALQSDAFANNVLIVLANNFIISLCLRARFAYWFTSSVLQHGERRHSTAFRGHTTTYIQI
jgi:hypothetical protein